MTIYLDVVLLENLCMNYIIIFATGYIMKIQMKQWKNILSALIGGIYSIVAYLDILPIYSSLFMKAFLSIVMVYLAYNAKGIKILFKQLIIFYLTSFVFGGCAFALLYFIKPQNILLKNGVYVGIYPLKIALLGGIVGFIITHIAFKIVKTKLRKKDMIYNINLKIDDKETTLTAMLDTGNLLRDPITKIPVIVVERDKLYNILPFELLNNIESLIGGDKENNIDNIINKEYLTKLRMIPFSSIGKKNGMLIGIKADSLTIQNEEYETRRNVIVAIFPEKLSNNYSALFGLDLLERSEENEFVTNIKTQY